MYGKRVFRILAALLVSVLAAAPGLPAGDSDAEARLPLTKLVLFSSGVGYFQRDGFVEGSAALELKFKSGEINDLLKSMVLRDFDGGSITGVNYASRDPLAKTLKSFAIDLTGNPGLAGILAQLRGAEVETSAPEAVRGTIVGVEARPSGENPEATEHYLNLLTQKGLKSVRLAGLNDIRLVSPELERELRQALALLGESHNTDKKKVLLNFSGQGRRRVQVGYILETPVWKTSYRLVLGEGDSHFLQGWAIVENTTDEDWREVRLALVSGRPISFIMDLYQPLYLSRPEVRLDIAASLQPQTYEEAMETEEAEKTEIAASAKAAPRSRPSLAAGELRAEAPAEAMDLTRGVSSAAAAAEVGEFFQYAIAHPVSLARQESALLPIVNQPIEGQRVSIYNERVHAKHPLNGLRLRNSTGLHLSAGPFTVFEEGSYAGDARIEDLPAGAERLISFSMDLDTEVESAARSLPDTLLKVSITRGNLISTRLLRRERTYTVKNTGSKGRTLLIEHPLDRDWTLVEPAAASERARDVYRFALQVEPRSEVKGVSGKPGSASLKVVEEQQQEQTVVLSNLGSDWIEYYLQARVVSEQVKAALRKLNELKNTLSSTVRERQQVEKQIQQIHSEQSRIRDNMDSLEHSSALYKRYVTTLSAQEDELGNLKEKLDRLSGQELEQKKAVDTYLLSLEVK